MYYHISAQTHQTLTTFEYHKHEMRWYPRGIQKLVSTYELPETPGGVGGGGRGVPSPVQISYSQEGVNWGSQNSECQVLSAFQFSGWRWGKGVNWSSQNSKCQVLSKFQFGGGGVKLEKSKLKVPSPVQISIFRWAKSQNRVNWNF